MIQKLGAHFFRHEYGRLVAMLSRRVGLGHLELVEDAVQFALLAAVESWTRAGVPENPPAWLFRVAHNHVVGELRQRARRERLVAERGRDGAGAQAAGPTTALAGEVRDDLLRMLFACCDDSIPVESQLVIALKTLCGFDVREIAERLFISEANVYKRLGRARSRLREVSFEPDDLSPEQLASRLPAVQSILYLLFTEGYLSCHAELAIRRELCDEAKRLAHVLAEHPVGAKPETSALLALMHLHAARMAARQDAGGGLLLLEEQDRSCWDHAEIQTGLAWLAKSAQGDVFSRYHAEAGIAAEHCLAPSFEQIRWDRGVLRVARAACALCAAHAESCRRRRAVAWARGRARDRRGPRAAVLARGFVHVDGRAGRPARTLRPRRAGATLSGYGARLRTVGSRAGRTAPPFAGRGSRAHMAMRPCHPRAISGGYRKPHRRVLVGLVERTSSSTRDHCWRRGRLLTMFSRPKHA